MLGTNTTPSTDEEVIHKFDQQEQRAIGSITTTVSGVLKVKLDKLKISDSKSPPNFVDPTAKDTSKRSSRQRIRHPRSRSPHPNQTH